MLRRILLLLMIFAILPTRAAAEPIHWAEFDIPWESLDYAMNVDIRSVDSEQHLSWIDILAVAASKTGGECGVSSVRLAAEQLQRGLSPEEILGELYRYFDYYKEVYTAVLGGFLGNFSVWNGEQWKPTYGLKAFSPIASGCGYSHYDDFGTSRTYGYQRKHLGNDLMGNTGTPIVAVEGGVVEAMGWNRYGGWRVGIRSFDSRRYYYYAHLQKDHPFAEGLQPGDIVQPGQLIGFMGRTGYSEHENINNIEVTHLHFGMQLIFDESQKECDSEIWIDVYDIVRLLSAHRASYVKVAGKWKRCYPFADLDVSNNLTQESFADFGCGKNL